MGRYILLNIKGRSYISPWKTSTKSYRVTINCENYNSYFIRLYIKAKLPT